MEGEQGEGEEEEKEPEPEPTGPKDIMNYDEIERDWNFGFYEKALE